MPVPKQSLVFLVDPPALPNGLAQALEREGCKVETLPTEQVSGALLISAPQAIVAPRRHADEVARAIRGAATSLEMPFLVVAPPEEVNRYRAQMAREVTVLVPSNVDPSALAIRVNATIKQASNKRVRPRTLLGVGDLSNFGAPSKAASPPRPAAPPPPIPPTNPLSAPEPIEPEPLEPESIEPDPIDPEPRDAALLTDADEIDESTNVTNFKPAKPPPPGAPFPAPTSRSAAPPIPKSTPAPPAAKPSTEESDDDPTRIVSKPAIHQWIDVKGTSSRPPPPIPVEAPVELGLPATEVLKLRIALVDDDVTRADSIGRALRLEGQDVLLATAGSTAPRWALLRQFAPQVIVMDSDSPHDGGLREALSEDPFLRETPVVFHPFSRLFNENTGKSDVKDLDDKLAGIGKTELEFTLGLESGRSMEVARRKINPGRLLALLTEFGRSVVITSNNAGEVMTWTLAGGLAGTAEVQTPSGVVTLTASQALDHVLAKPHAQVSVQARKDVRVSRGENVYDLLERAYREYLPRTPVGPSSPGASAPRASRPRDPAAAQLLDAIPEVTRQVSSPARPLIPTDAFLAIRDDSKVVGGTRKVSGGMVVLGLIFVFGLGAGAAIGVARFTKPAPKLVASGESTQGELNPAPAARSSAPENDGEGKGPPAEEAEEAAPSEETPDTSNKPASGDRWTIPEPVTVQTCEEILDKTPDAFANKPKWQGGTTWKKARTALMAGRQDDAHKAMCESAFIDPGGQASAGLAGLYLSQRALEQAEAWARKALEAKPGNRRAKELLGDALNQMGRLDEAKAVWLETLKLSETDEAKLKVVAKTLASSAQTAIKGGDTPLAERLLRRAATFDPESASTAAALAHVLLRNEQAGLAEKWANFAQSLDPEDPEALFVLGELALIAGDKDEARQLFEKIPKQAKISSQARERLAEM